MDKRIIFEQATHSDIEILEESSLPNGQYRLKFKAKLQEADTINNNRRFYPSETLEQVYLQLKDKAQDRKLVGEMDHPQPQGDQAAKMKRSSTISAERACFLITELQWDGTSIYAVCETLSNRMGTDLYCLIKDGVTLGFSLRAFGETKRRPDGSTEVVAKGIKALTYDLVVNPSHDSSVITEILTESTDVRELIRGMKQLIIEESEKVSGNTSGGLLEETSISGQMGNEATRICFGNVCTIAPIEEAIEYILDNVVSDKTLPKIRVNKL